MILWLLSLVLLIQSVQLSSSEGLDGRTNRRMDGGDSEQCSVGDIYCPSESLSRNVYDFPPPQCGIVRAVGQRIVGGRDASEGQFPWQAQLHAKNTAGEVRLACGGTLISERVIVTAAHCVKASNIADYKVFLGKVKSTSTSSTRECAEQEFRVEKVDIHPDYSTTTLQNDIALIWIKSIYGQGVRYTDYVQPACLPDPHSNVEAKYRAGTLGSVSGWGYTEEKSSIVSEKLQFVKVPVVDFAQCRKSYAKTIGLDERVQFCAAGDGKDACAGDSGGPFTVKVGGAKTYLAGVVSFGLGCARKTYPGVYTKVSTFVPWIRSRMDPRKIETKPTTTTTSITTSTSTPKPTTTTTRPTTRQTTTTTKLTTTTTIATTTKSSTTTTKAMEGTFVADGVDLDAILNKDSKILGPVCDDQFSLLRCSSGKIIEVISVFYGWREDESHCVDTRFFQHSHPRDNDLTRGFFQHNHPRDNHLTRGAAAAPDARDTLRCVIPGATKIVHKRCDQRTSCWIFHRMMRGLRDPCPRRTKHITVTYRCVSR